jgi:hypothetical protein
MIEKSRNTPTEWVDPDDAPELIRLYQRCTTTSKAFASVFPVFLMTCP